jgi:predicted Zn-ribbon and HTH transcriptional regulator
LYDCQRVADRKRRGVRESRAVWELELLAGVVADYVQYRIDEAHGEALEADIDAEFEREEKSAIDAVEAEAAGLMEQFKRRAVATPVCACCGHEFGRGYAETPDHCMDCIDEMYAAVDPELTLNSNEVLALYTAPQRVVMTWGMFKGSHGVVTQRRGVKNVWVKLDGGPEIDASTDHIEPEASPAPAAETATFRVTFTRGGFYNDSPVVSGFSTIETAPADWTVERFEYYFQTAGLSVEKLPRSDWEQLFDSPEVNTND